MKSQLSIPELIAEVQSGRLRIPGFQRDFEWDLERRLLLVDSLYKGYPIGSILVWRTDELVTARSSIAGYDIPGRPEHTDVSYVLDGQQRIGTILLAFVGNLPTEPDIYLDLHAEDHPQECSFVAFSDRTAIRPHHTLEIDYGRYIPLRHLSDAEGLSAAMGRLQGDPVALERLTMLLNRYATTIVPVMVLEMRNHVDVAISFRRLNSQAKELDNFFLLKAISWSNDFDLSDSIGRLVDELYGESGGTDRRDLVLATIAGYSTQNPGIERVIALRGEQVRTDFPVVAEGLRRALDFLRSELHIWWVGDLPSERLLIPLGIYFAHRHTLRAGDRAVLTQWVWRLLCGERYSRNSEQPLVDDIALLGEFGHNLQMLLERTPVAEMTSDHFVASYSASSPTYRARLFVTLLHAAEPRSWYSEHRIGRAATSSAANRAEKHHIVPRAYLRRIDDSIEPDVIANIALLTAEDNRRIADSRPGDYFKEVPEGALARAFVPRTPEPVSRSTFEAFVQERSRLLVEFARKLMGGAT